MTLEEAVDFCKNQPEDAAKILLKLAQLEEALEKAYELIEKQSLEIKRLNDIIAKDSNNSSKPPSSDNKFKKNSSNNKKSNTKRKRGAQKGHKGSHLKFESNPDKTVVLSVSQCSCGCKLDKIQSSHIVKRQLFDIPKIKMEVTEFEQHTKVCPNCKTVHKPDFPDNIKACTQYGDNIKALIAYLNSYQMIPYERISEMIKDITSHKISQGTIFSMLQSYHNQLQDYTKEIKVLLLKEKVLHCDETGVNIKGKLYYTHVVSSNLITYYMLHAKRGKEAMNAMDILPQYQYIAVHDHWKPYDSYICKHSYCNAHHLRELTFIEERENEIWAKDMHRLLTIMNKTVHKAKNAGKSALSKTKIDRFMRYYDKICLNALNYYPPPDEKHKKTKGKIKQKKGKNLLDRLVEYKEETLRFLIDFDVPFTNNLAERDLRMIKVKQKISGTFASFRGGEIFNSIRGYISTVKKNGRPILEELANVLVGKPYIPVGVGC